MPTLSTLLSLILEAFRLITAQPGPPELLFEPARELVVEAAGPDQAGLPDPWPVIDQAAAIYAQAINDVRLRYSPPGGPAIVLFTSPEVLLYTPQADGSDGLERDAALLCLSLLEQRGFFDLLARLPAMGVGLCLEPAGGWGGKRPGMVECDRLNTLRSLSRAAAARSVPAREAGDFARVVAGVEQQLALARIAAAQVSRQPRLFRSRVMVALLRDVSSWALTGRLPPAQAGEMLAAIERQARLPEPSAFLKVQGLELQTLIAASHTLDPGGDGRLLIHQYRQTLLDPAGAFSFGDPGQEPDLGPLLWPDLGPLLNVAGVNYATRARSLELAREYVRRSAAVGGEPHPRRARALTELEAWARALPRSDWVVRMYALSATPTIRAMLRDDSDVRMKLDGARLMLAIEAYRARQTRLPATLDDLVPGFLKSVPPDPYSGQPFVYRVTDAAAFVPGSGYLLYSVWEDGTDNKGLRTSAKNQWAAPPSRRTNCDYIVNDAADAREQAAGQ